jgi:hypothetical protein
VSVKDDRAAWAAALLGRVSGSVNQPCSNQGAAWHCLMPLRGMPLPSTAGPPLPVVPLVECSVPLTVHSWGAATYGEMCTHTCTSKARCSTVQRPPAPVG